MDKSCRNLISEMLTKEGTAELEIETLSDNSDEEHQAELVFTQEQLKPHINFDCIGSSNEIDNGLTPFAELALQFESLHPKGWLKKRITKAGNGCTIPKFSVVYFHYNSYLEMGEVPFDSTFLREGRPIRIQLGVGAIYEGMEHSLLSMKKGERANFLVDPKLAFGEIGVPPRIPKNATILNIVEVHDVVDCGEAMREKEDDYTFKTHFESAMGFSNLAKDHFSHGLIPGAIKNYKKGIDECQKARPKNIEEEVELQKLYMKLYINIMVSYNHKKVKKPRQVISIARDAIEMVASLCNKSAKFFYNLGKAHLELSDYDKAIMNFKKSLTIEPKNPETISCLKELEKTVENYKSKESQMWSKALGIKKTENDENDTKKDDIGPSTTKKSSLCPMLTEKEVYDMEQEIYNLVVVLLKNKEWKHSMFPDVYMPYERVLYKRACEKLDLNYEEVQSGLRRYIKISLRENNQKFDSVQ